jgi:hypothetical protein
MKKLNYIIAAAILAGLTSCDVNNPKLPFDLDESLENNGAFLRVNEVISNAFELADPENAAYTIRVEYFDKENGGLMQNIEFFADYTRFFLNPDDELYIPETGPVITLNPNDFTIGDRGRPEATITVPFTTVINTLNLSAGDVKVEDRFLLKWIINLTDGRSFGSANSSPDVTGGAFFRAPGQARISAIQQLDETAFTGLYGFTQREPGPVPGAGTEWLFGESFEAELSVDSTNIHHGRVFTMEPYPGAGELDPVTVPIALTRTATVAADEIVTGHGCREGLAFGRARSTANLVEIDVNNDSEFVLVLTENVRVDCAVGPGDIIFDVEKVD